MPTEIHPTAFVARSAELGRDVSIGPYSIVGARVKIGDRTRIGPHVVIDGTTSIGEDNEVSGQANIGGAPQDLSYDGEPTCLEIGDRNSIREFVTINRGTIKGGGLTLIGSDCLFMACSHVAHDCEIGDRVMLANSALLAGHVQIGKGAVINGAAAAHQFVAIGSYAYIGGLTRVVQDVPPYLVLEGHPARVRKVNVVGLERAGFDAKDIDELRHAYRRIFRAEGLRRKMVQEIKEAAPGPLVLDLIESMQRTELGAKGRYRETLRSEFLRRGQERILNGVRAT